MTTRYFVTEISECGTIDGRDAAGTEWRLGSVETLPFARVRQWTEAPDARVLSSDEIEVRRLKRLGASAIGRRDNTLVVTYQLAYLNHTEVDLCQECVEAGDHERGEIGPVQRGAHRGRCAGEKHEPVRDPYDVEP